MSTRFHSYEDMGWVRPSTSACIPESYRGSDIVDWYGRIEQSVINLLRDAEKSNNSTYAARLKAFLETWQEHPIDGSLNRETIEILLAAAKQWARESWDLQSYFLSLQTRLRQLIASEEELPRDIDMGNDPLGGGGGGGGRGGGGGMPPMSPSFGPQGEEPGDLGGGGGGPEDAGLGGEAGEAGAGGDMPGAEGAEVPPGLGAEADAEAAGGGEAEEEEPEEPIP